MSKRCYCAALFGALYFTQGISEPTEGLVVQPTRWLLKSWGETNEQITSFAAWITLPWVMKPLYGLIADFLPLGRNPAQELPGLGHCRGLPRISGPVFLSSRLACGTLALLGSVSPDSRRRLYRRRGRRTDDRGRPAARNYGPFAVSAVDRHMGRHDSQRRTWRTVLRRLGGWWSISYVQRRRGCRLGDRLQPA